MDKTLRDISQIIEYKKNELLENLRHLVAIESVEGTPGPGKPFGEAVHEALESVLDLAKKMGFETCNHDGYVGTIEWGSGDEMLGILSHVDVVPAGDPAAWNTPPFELTVVNDYLCGRGVADDKGPLLSALYGMYALKELGITPQKRVRIIIGTNEETGWGCMKYYLSNCEIPSASFCPDGMFTVVNREKGIISLNCSKKLSDDITKGLSIQGGEARNLVPAKAVASVKLYNLEQKTCFEKAMNGQPVANGFTFELEQNSDDTASLVCKGKSAHAATPEKGANAILGLLKLLNSCDCLSKEIRNEFSNILRLIGETPDGAAMGLACRDEVSGALTLNLGKLDLKNGELTLQFDIRSPVTVSIDDLVEKVKSLLLENDFMIDYLDVKRPLYVPENSPLIKTLCDVYETVTGDKPVLHSIGGGTYARAFPNCVCFGSVYPSETLTVHSPNERTQTNNIIQNAKMYGLAIYELTK
jgi:succinyl-diaminopimelate desuccinylase